MSVLPPAGTTRKRAANAGDRSAMSRRQLLYDLERHPMEVSPLTQLFPVLVKKRPSWWNTQKKHALGVTPTPRTQDGGGKSGGAGGVDTTSSTTAGGGGGGDASIASNGEAPTIFGPGVPIPETIVWENNIPKGWYTYDPKERTVVRKKVETKQIQAAFLADAKYENDVVAVMYSQSPSGEKDTVEYAFITATELPNLLFENRRGKGTSILQKFVFPLTITHNDTISAVWTPTVLQVNRRQNVHNLFDERVEVNERCITFEGQMHLTQLMQATSRLKQQVREACENLVNHFAETEPKHKITRLVAVFKMNDASQLQLLLATSCRVARADSLVESTSSSDSSLHRKYRVSIELATKFSELERRTEEQYLSALASRTEPDTTGTFRRRGVNAEFSYKDADSPGKGKEGKSQSTKEEEPYVGRIKASRLGFVVRPSFVDEEKRKSERRKPDSRSQSATLMIMGDEESSPASTVPRSQSRSGSAGMRGSTTSYPSPTGGRRATSPSRARAIRVRAKGGQEFTIAELLLEVQKSERPEATNEQKLRARKILDRLTKKVDVKVLRETYLQQKPDLNDAEKMELFFLRLEHTQQQKGSTRPSSSQLQQHGRSDEDQSSFLLEDDFDLLAFHRSVSPEHRHGTLAGKQRVIHNAKEAQQTRQTVFEGVEEDVHPAIQTQLSDHVYGCQSYFALRLEHPFQLSLCASEDAIESPEDAADYFLYTHLRDRKKKQEEDERSCSAVDLEFQYDLISPSSPPSSKKSSGTISIPTVGQHRAVQHFQHLVYSLLASPAASELYSRYQPKYNRPSNDTDTKLSTKSNQSAPTANQSHQDHQAKKEDETTPAAAAAVRRQKSPSAMEPEALRMASAEGGRRTPSSLAGSTHSRASSAEKGYSSEDFES